MDYRVKTIGQPLHPPNRRFGKGPRCRDWFTELPIQLHLTQGVLWTLLIFVPPQKLIIHREHRSTPVFSYLVCCGSAGKGA